MKIKKSKIYLILLIYNLIVLYEYCLNYVNTYFNKIPSESKNENHKKVELISTMFNFDFFISPLYAQTVTSCSGTEQPPGEPPGIPPYDAMCCGWDLFGFCLVNASVCGVDSGICGIDVNLGCATDSGPKPPPVPPGDQGDGCKLKNPGLPGPGCNVVNIDTGPIHNNPPVTPPAPPALP